uniref:Secreted protein n=1 Tax=Ixodes ricinus TaxID=34613 RepID=A0A147BUP9_IXORI
MALWALRFSPLLGGFTATTLLRRSVSNTRGMAEVVSMGAVWGAATTGAGERGVYARMLPPPAPAPPSLTSCCRSICCTFWVGSWERRVMRCCCCCCCSLRAASSSATEGIGAGCTALRGAWCEKGRTTVTFCCGATWETGTWDGATWDAGRHTLWGSRVLLGASGCCCCGGGGSTS